MGVGGQHHAPAALPPGKTRYPLYRWLGGSQGRCGRMRKISLRTGFDPRTVQPVASRYTDWAMPAHTSILLLNRIQLTYTVWVQSVKTRVDNCLSLHEMAFVNKYCSPFITRFFYNNPEVKFIESCNQPIRKLHTITTIPQTHKTRQIFRPM